MASLEKNIIICFLLTQLCFCHKIYSQDYNKIQKSDTVYVLFHKKKFEQIFLPQPKGYGDYYFYFDKFYKFRTINFYHNIKTPDEKIVKKSFLKKNKDLLIDYSYLTNMFSYEDAKKLLLFKKKIYLIDYENIGWFSIKIIEVKVSDYSPISIE